MSIRIGQLAVGRRTLLGAVGSFALSGVSATSHSGKGAQAAMSYTLSEHTTVSAERLDTEVENAYPLFDTASIFPAFDTSAHGAANDVELYRLTTSVHIERRDETIEVTGLLAVPAGASGEIPIVSWQHGTILSFDQVPSNMVKLADPEYTLSDEEDSLETLFNLHRFAAQGFAVIAADYVGKGPLRNGLSEAYVVQDVTTETCLAMLDAGYAALDELGISPGKLFLNGWSQGSVNTQWLHQALGERDTDIIATAVSSPFIDLNMAWEFFAGRLEFELPPDTDSYPDPPSWLALCMVVLLGSYEHWYSIDGLMQSAVRPEYLALSEKYFDDYAIDFDPDEPFPAASELLVEDFFEPETDALNLAFLQQLADNNAAHHVYDSEIRFYTGYADEATHPAMTAIAMEGMGDLAISIPVPKASHRATFLASLYGDESSLEGNINAVDWFNMFLNS